MKNLLVTIMLIGSMAHGAEKIFIVNGKKVSPREAFDAANKGAKVQRCAEVANASFIDASGKVIEKAMKCSEVTLYANKSGLPTWKSVNNGTKW